MKERYLGDGVYIQVLNGGLVLTTGTHEISEADNTVCLEPSVALELKKYLDEVFQ